MHELAGFFADDRFNDLKINGGSLDAEFFLAALRESGATVCGYHPIALLLATLSLLDGEEIFQQTLDYQTSAEIAGGYEH